MFAGLSFLKKRGEGELYFITPLLLESVTKANDTVEVGRLEGGFVKPLTIKLNCV